MHNYLSIFGVTGSLCLLITLVLARGLVGIRSSAFMKTPFPRYQNVLKTHLDYLMMTGLLMTFVLATEQVAWVSAATHSGLQEVNESAVDAYIYGRMRTARIPGLALAVVQGNHVAYLKGYGVAGPDGRPVTPQTPFILGSTSKSFTALAVMQLVESGKIELDAPVTRYLPWFRTRNVTNSDQISVRQLLHHTSGLPTYAGRQGLSDNDQSNTALEKGVRDLSTVQLSRPAGQGYEYSNANYNTLGLIVQTVSATSYEDYVRSAIFAPLRMSHSAAAPSDPAVRDIATGYRSWLFWPVAFDAPFPRRATPSGSLMSSVEDMAHYVTAQMNGGVYDTTRLLSPQGVATLHTPGARMGRSSSYGMGWVIQGQTGSTRIWHNGDESNFHSNLLLLPDQHIGIVILMNAGGFFKSTESNIPIEGVAAILLGDGLNATTNPPSTVLPQVMLLGALLVLLLWIACSYFSVRRWQRRRELPTRGIRLIWRFWLPLTVELGAVGLAWVIVPARFNTPLDTIALFAPDAFVVITLIGTLSLSSAMVRTWLTLRPVTSPAIEVSSSKVGSPVPVDWAPGPHEENQHLAPVRTAARFYAAISVGVIAFQIALVAGAPWGACTMGGVFPGQLPLALRIAALAQAALIAGMAAVVISRARLMHAGRFTASRWLVWLVVAFAAVSLVLNLVTPSAGERAIWAPVALLLLVSSAVVAIEGVSSDRRSRGIATAISPAADVTDATMQAMTQRAYGSPEILSLQTIARPKPAPHDVLVRVHAAGLHIGDCFGVRGTPLLMRLATGLLRPKPGVPGFDLAGVVVAVGSSVTTFQPGDSVFGASHGTCAEYAVAPDVQLALKPVNLTFGQAAALPTSALAALHGLRDAGALKRGHHVLINGAAGGIGTFAIQIAKALGAEVTGVCSPANLELVRSLGADHVIDYTREDFTRAGRQYDLIFDNVENRSLADCRRALTPTGTLILNSGSGSRGLALLVRLLWPLVLSPFVRHNIRRYLSKPNRADLGVLRDLVESRALTPVIDRTFPLRETAAALRYIETGHARGKVVITVR